MSNVITNKATNGLPFCSASAFGLGNQTLLHKCYRHNLFHVLQLYASEAMPLRNNSYHTDCSQIIVFFYGGTGAPSIAFLSGKSLHRSYSRNPLYVASHDISFGPSWQFCSHNVCNRHIFVDVPKTYVSFSLTNY